jgi:hypothetical protein
MIHVSNDDLKQILKMASIFQACAIAELLTTARLDFTAHCYETRNNTQSPPHRDHVTSIPCEGLDHRKLLCHLHCECD